MLENERLTKNFEHHLFDKGNHLNQSSMTLASTKFSVAKHVNIHPISKSHTFFRFFPNPGAATSLGKFHPPIRSWHKWSPKVAHIPFGRSSPQTAGTLTSKPHPKGKTFWTIHDSIQAKVRY